MYLLSWKNYTCIRNRRRISTERKRERRTVIERLEERGVFLIIEIHGHAISFKYYFVIEAKFVFVIRVLTAHTRESYVYFL